MILQENLGKPGYTLYFIMIHLFPSNKFQVIYKYYLSETETERMFLRLDSFK